MTSVIPNRQMIMESWAPFGSVFHTSFCSERTHIVSASHRSMKQWPGVRSNPTFWKMNANFLQNKGNQIKAKHTQQTQIMVSFGSLCRLRMDLQKAVLLDQAVKN